MSFLTSIINLTTPHQDDRPKAAFVDTVVIHYTDTWTLQDTMDIFLSTLKVSCHYLLSEDGQIFSFVDTKKRAWHAGQSFWLGRSSVNDFSIGIELQNPGEKHFEKYGTWQAYADVQMESLEGLLHVLRCPVIVGHSDIAPNRKKDPGPHFDWPWMKAIQTKQTNLR